MEYRKLQEFIDIKTGKLDANASSENGKYPFFTCSKDILRINTYSFECECVLLAGNGDLNVKYYDGKFDAYQRTYILECKNNIISTKYLYYFMKKYVEVLRNQSIGGVIKYIKLSNISDALIPVHNKKQQEKIVKEISQVEEIIDIRNKQLEELQNIIKSQFVEMFGDIEDTKYNVMKLQELTNLITDGEHKKPNYTDEGKPFISVVNITTGELKFDNCKFVSDEDTLKFQKRCKPERNDILYTKVGATYGRSAIVNTDKEFSLYVSVCLIKPKMDVVNPIFLNYTLRQPYVKKQADKCIKGIGVPDLHLIEIKNFNIILPPIELQNKFAEFVKQVDKQKFEIENSLKEMQELYESLMEKYFG